MALDDNQPVTLNELSVDFSRQDLNAALSSAKSVYEKNGCFLARGLFSPEDLQPVRADIDALADIQAQVSGLDLPDDVELCRKLAILGKHDRRTIARIFDACRRLLPVHQLSVDPRLVEIARAATGTDLLAASDMKPVRIDLPNESKFLSPWHQDYPYVMDSLDAVVFWIPFHDVDESNGALSVSPGSYHEGLQDLVLTDPENSADNKQMMMHIADLSVLERNAPLRIPASLGDVLVFNTLTLHASAPNTSDAARLTLQVRFGNFRHPYAIEKGWPGSMRDGSVFHKIHPEHIVKS
jgi:ectoine hydroxylase-related dioxygenase (phytanoyl-CoA dioxygenase family)